jgi:hypothetical protein
MLLQELNIATSGLVWTGSEYCTVDGNPNLLLVLQHNRLTIREAYPASDWGHTTTTIDLADPESIPQALQAIREWKHKQSPKCSSKN